MRKRESKADSDSERVIERDRLPDSIKDFQWPVAFWYEDGILGNFSLQCQWQRGNTLRETELQGIVISLMRPLTVKGGPWRASNGDHAVVFRDEHSWTRQGLLTRESIGVL